MRKHRHKTFEEVLAYEFRDPDFRKEWEASEGQYQIIKSILRERLKHNMSQRDLAERAGQPMVKIEAVVAKDELEKTREDFFTMSDELAAAFSGLSDKQRKQLVDEAVKAVRVQK